MDYKFSLDEIKEVGYTMIKEGKLNPDA